MKTFLMVLVMVMATAAVAGDAPGWHRAIGLLQYLEGDYPGALASQDAAELEEQRGLSDELVAALTELGSEGAPFLERAKQLRGDIVAQASGAQVSKACRALVADIVATQGLSRSPRGSPDLLAGQALFEAQCSSCHGVDGRAQTEAARAMSPKPANFHDEARMLALSPYRAFNTITFGVTGTPMPAFTTLTDAQRWTAAFYLFTLRQPACETRQPRASLEQLATSTDAQLAETFGLAQVPCLRRVMPKADEAGAIARAQAGLDEAQRLARGGDFDGARRAIVDAYLLGVEPIEPTLRARNPALVEALEQGFTRARLHAQDHVDVSADVGALKALLDDTGATRAGDFWSVFVAAMLILLREGFEATVVVGALLAVMKKMEAGVHVRVVHAGWISALLFGVVAFLFGQSLLAGANREWLETVVSLVAVGMLLYAALWLNARANLSVFMGELRAKMKDAMGRGSLVGLFMISFTSVGRETVETAIFLEGLAGDSRDGVLFGALAGGVLLLALVLFVRTVGFRLPMKTLFKASTVLLVATAVMLLGKGLHGLQELGVLPLVPLRFVTIAPLGLFPDAVSLLPQLALAVAPLTWWWVTRPRTPGTPVTT